MNRDLPDGPRAEKRLSLMTLPFDDLTPEQKVLGKKTAATVGRMAAAPYHFLGIPKPWDKTDYVNLIIEPLYTAGACGSGLYDTWIFRPLDDDPRVKSFINAARKATVWE